MRFEPDPVAVGRDIDAYCTKCKMDLGHTIVAMVAARVVQVRCNTCGGVHRYKAAKSQEKSAPAAVKKRTAEGGTTTVAAAPAAPKPKKPRATKAAPTATPKERFEEWQQLVGQDEEAGRDARAYSMREAFEEGEVVRHPKFGLGRVTSVEGEDRILVLFREGEKTLVANRA